MAAPRPQKKPVDLDAKDPMVYARYKTMSFWTPRALRRGKRR